MNETAAPKFYVAFESIWLVFSTTSQALILYLFWVYSDLKQPEKKFQLLEEIHI